MCSNLIDLRLRMIPTFKSDLKMLAPPVLIVTMCHTIVWTLPRCHFLLFTQNDAFISWMYLCLSPKKNIASSWCIVFCFWFFFLGGANIFKSLTRRFFFLSPVHLENAIPFFSNRASSQMKLLGRLAWNSAWIVSRGHLLGLPRCFSKFDPETEMRGTPRIKKKARIFKPMLDHFPLVKS